MIRRPTAAHAAHAALAAVLTLAVLPAAAADPQPDAGPAAPPAGVDAEAIVRRAEAVLAGGRSEYRALLSVLSGRRRVQRSLRFRAWLDPERGHALVRVLSPPKRAGIAFLSLPPNLWSYRPDGDEAVLVPPAERLGAWMESDFGVDDVLHPSSDLRVYEPRLLRVDDAAGKGSARVWVIELRARAAGDAPWQRIVEWVEVEHTTLLRREFYAEGEVPVRSVRFGDLRVVAGRLVPHRWVATSREGKGGESRIELESITFDAVFAPDLFSLRRLRAGQARGGPAP